MTCGCEAVTDREGWHRYRNTTLCDDARVSRRERDRAKYARARLRAGVVVKPMAPRATWKPGSAIVIPEVDPL